MALYNFIVLSSKYKREKDKAFSHPSCKPFDKICGGCTSKGLKLFVQINDEKNDKVLECILCELLAIHISRKRMPMAQSLLHILY